MAKVKICGLANYDDSLDATNLGADFLGFHFIKESPKKVSEKMVCDIVSKLPPFVVPVGVFANEEQKVIEKVLKKCSLKNVQLNGDESPEFCQALKANGNKVFKYFAVQGDESALIALSPFVGNVDYFVLDIGFVDGETQKFNYDLAIKAKELGISFFISGKISPDNVKEALQKVVPFGLDGDAGIERLAKRKDYEKMSSFIKLSHGLK